MSPEPERARTLLEKAKAAKTARRLPTEHTVEDYELALALVKGDVTVAQAATAWGLTTGGSGVYARAVSALRAAVREGLTFHWGKDAP